MFILHNICFTIPFSPFLLFGSPPEHMMSLTTTLYPVIRSQVVISFYTHHQKVKVFRGAWDVSDGENKFPFLPVVIDLLYEILGCKTLTV